MLNQLREILANDVFDHKVLLTRDILSVFPTIENHLEPDILIKDTNIVYAASHSKVFCALDFSRIDKYEAAVDYTFGDLLKERDSFESPLLVLNYAYSILDEEGWISILPLEPDPDKYIISKFLKCSKFADINFKGRLVVAKKRPLKKYAFDHGRLTFEETNSPETIKYIQYFAKGLFKGHNFDFSIDDLFAPHSDFFVCYRTETKEIVSFLRYTWHLPKHPLPCMLATNIEDGSHLRLDDPLMGIQGEIFAPYISTISAVKSYKELIKNILEHCLIIGATKVYTTYNVLEPISGEFFKKVFGFRDGGVVLRYGDFGGEWGLLEGGKSDIIPITNKFIIKNAES